MRWLSFGKDALYIRKYRGTWPSIANSRGWALVVLGNMHLAGIGRTPDVASARAYYHAAVTEEGFTTTAPLLAAFPAPR